MRTFYFSTGTCCTRTHAAVSPVQHDRMASSMLSSNQVPTVHCADVPNVAHRLPKPGVPRIMSSAAQSASARGARLRAHVGPQQAS